MKVKSASIGLLACITVMSMAQAADPVVIEHDPIQRIDARFKLYKTNNQWNFIELDTQTGRVWQVQYTINDDENRMRTAINPDVLTKDGKPGRFTLYPTRNIWNYLLLDQDSGKVWQVQYSIDENKMIIPINDANLERKSEWKQ